MHAKAARRILDMVDVDSEKWTAYAETARFPARNIWAREGRTLLAFERLAAARIRSQPVRLGARVAALRGSGAGGRPAHQLDLQRRRSRLFLADARLRSCRSPAQGADLVFTGRMDYRPNIDAVRWFAREVMPVLRQRVPAARFWIVGAAPTGEVRALADLPGVQVTGTRARYPALSCRRRCRGGAAAHRPRHPEQAAGGDGDGATGGCHAGSISGRACGAGTGYSAGQRR